MDEPQSTGLETPQRADIQAISPAYRELAAPLINLSRLFEEPISGEDAAALARKYSKEMLSMSSPTP